MYQSFNYVEFIYDMNETVHLVTITILAIKHWGVGLLPPRHSLPSSGTGQLESKLSGFHCIWSSSKPFAHFALRHYISKFKFLVQSGFVARV